MQRHERLTRLAIAVAVTALVAACGTQARPAPPPAQTAQPAQPAASAAPAASPSQQPLQITGEIKISPTHGPWDTVVTTTATGLRPQTKYDLAWGTANGAWKLSEDRSKYVGRAYQTVQNVLKSVTTDAAGAFTTTFAVPHDFGYAHDILILDDQKTIRNKVLFDVDMETTITPTSGPVGTPITVEVRGLGWQSYQNSFQLAYDNAYTGWVSSITTHGSAKFVIPATGKPGVHYITLGHSEFGAPYMNPNQQPVVASRPFPHLPFTVTDGPAVLPAPASQQGIAQVNAAAKPVDKGIWTAPYAATVGSPVTINAKGLPANSDVELTWTTMVGNRSVTGFEERTRTLAKARTDAQGSFTSSLAMPDDLGGTHDIKAKVGDTVVASTKTFILANAFPLTAGSCSAPAIPATCKTSSQQIDRGPAGTVVTVHLKGVGWTETEQIYHVVYDNAFAGYACAFQSAGDLTIYLTMTGDKGWHFIDMYPGIYQGTETRPANYKMPQLTALDDHPGEKMPIFRWAFLIE